MQILFDPQDLRRIVDACFDLRFGIFTKLQRERHIFKNCHVRIKRIILEHHRDIPVLGRHIIDQLVPDINFTVGDLLQTRDHTKRRRFATARGADKHDELAALDVEVDIIHG